MNIANLPKEHQPQNPWETYQKNTTQEKPNGRSGQTCECQLPMYLSIWEQEQCFTG